MGLLTMVSGLLMVGGAQGGTLREAATARHFNIGSAVRIDYLRDDIDGGKYAATAAAQFNFVELENDFKPPAVWTGPRTLNLAGLDWMLGAPGEPGWAPRHGLKLRGHVLVYARDDGYTLPGWLRQAESTLTKEEAAQLLREYIITLVGRYRGKVAMWDVANEAIDDAQNDRPFNLRDSLWYRKLGPEFLVLAFKWAHEADPRAELYYNEYSVEGGGRKADHLLDLVRWLQAKGAPITGVGLQYHIDAHTQVSPGDGHYQLIRSLRDLRLAFMITELDVAVPVKPFPQADPRFGTVPQNPADLDDQAKVYADLMRMALSAPNCHGLNVWGFDDLHSWIPTYQRGRGAATLFDADYHPKPAFFALRNLLSK